MSHHDHTPRPAADVRRRLVVLAALPLSASILVLAIAGVGAPVWAMQGLAVALACVVGLLCHRWVSRVPAAMAIAVALVGLAATLLADATSPRRWLHLGPLLLYAAPTVLPALLLLRHALLGRGRWAQWAADASVVAAGAVLAAQPDASQGLALLAAVLAADLMTHRARGGMAVGGGLALLAAWAVSRPDPLQPVPHVEGVIALAFAQSWPAGLWVVASVLGWVVGLWWVVPGALPAYYAVLLACSVAGLTPAPLIGYGAGPWLGYGLAVALAPACDALSGLPRPRVVRPGSPSA